MVLGRILRHLCTTSLHIRNRFPQSTLDAIEQAVGASEVLHSGEIRFAIEAALDFPPLLHGVTSRQRALDVFSLLRVWNTEHNSGVLIYLLLKDRKVEIVADHGIAAKVDQSEWEFVCRGMERAFSAGDFKAGALAGIQDISTLLARYFPADARNPNELINRPQIL
ncbi:MAG: TPM domain-containing protein [Burkholderiales bacterium]